MALKYYIEYNDVAGVTHRLNISDSNFSGSATQIDGFVDYKGSDDDDPLKVLRGQGVRVNLEASTTSTFDDLYTEEEKSIAVEYLRSGSTVFNGWLNPEGFYEDYVNSEWLVSFDCFDGLGYLENLAFVNAAGGQVTGIMNDLEIISLCLQRTEIQQNINIDLNTFYTGLSTNVDPSVNVKQDTARFMSDDQSDQLTCKEVLESVLGKYGAVLQNRGGEWFIYQPNSLADNATLTYFRYDYLGVALSPATATLDTSVSVGSEIDSFAIHHAEANQRINIKPSIGALKINWKYGLVKSFNDNVYLNSGGTTTTISEWTVNSSTNLTISSSQDGVDMDIVADGAGILNLTADDINLTAGVVVDFFLKTYPTEWLGSQEVFLPIKIILDDGGGTLYYLAGDETWSTTDTEIKIIHQTPTTETEFYSNPFVRTETNIKTAPLPVSGDLYMEIYTPEMESGGTIDAGDSIYVYEVRISNEADSGGLLKGELHTFERSTKPSSKVPETIEVTTGDNTTDTYLGTLYQSDGATVTSTWFREGKTEAFSILNLMGKQIMTMHQKPARVFSGSLYGYFDPLSTVTIDGFTGVFMPIGYNYRTKENLMSVRLRRIFNDDITDIIYTYRQNTNATVIRPTIKS